MNIRHISYIALAGLLLAGAAGTGTANEFGRGGGGGGHFSAAHSSASHFAARTHFAAPRAAARSYGGARYASGSRYAGGARFAASTRGAGARYGASRFAAGASAYRGWRGGYWRGGYWPRAYYGPGFLWFLAALPAFCTAYWFDDVPYYYYNDVYYLWSPSADGYVATDPPPVADGGDDNGGAVDNGDYSDAAPATDVAPAQAQPAQGNVPGDADGGALAAAAGDVYAYPSGNQSPQQQSTDRAECSSWAISQVTANGAAASPSDARRAMIACLDGRGYSAN